MNQRQKFVLYTFASAIFTSIIGYALFSTSISGIAVLVFAILAFLSAATTISLFIAYLSKNPRRTFDKIMDILFTFPYL